MKLRIQGTPRLPHWPWWAVLIVGVWGGLVCLGVWLQHFRRISIETCLFKRITCLPCPSCGGTRGVLAILGGHPLQGFLFNPLLFAVLAAMTADLLLRLLFARGLRLEASARQRTILWLCLAVLVVLNWTYLIVRGM